MDVGGVGDAAHEWDEVCVVEVGADGSGVACAGEQFGAVAEDLCFEFGGAWEHVLGAGGDFDECGVGDLAFDDLGEEVGERGPGVVVCQTLFAAAGECFEAGGGDGFEECFGGREVPVDRADAESCAAGDVVELQRGAFVDEFSGDGEDVLPVAGGVLSLRRHVFQTNWIRHPERGRVVRASG